MGVLYHVSTRKSRPSCIAIFCSFPWLSLFAFYYSILLYSGKLSQSQAASLLRNAGIAVSSSGNCSNRNNPSCTSLDQIRAATINGIIAFKQHSGCAVTITGGTETGHASGTYSHANGYKVDISHTTCVTNYIHSHFTYKGLRGDGAPMYDDASGNRYADEGSHWDITYY